MQEKAPFIYEYYRPLSDWVDLVKVVIQPEEYLNYRIERRFGPSWWLIGQRPQETPKYHWEEVQIGEIGDFDLKRFIEWAKFEHRRGRVGSRITEIKMISVDFDIFNEIAEITKRFGTTEST